MNAERIINKEDFIRGITTIGGMRRLCTIKQNEKIEI
jgi:hypothetical protein